MLLDSNSAASEPRLADPPPAVVAGEMRNLSRRVAAAMAELTQRPTATGDLVDAQAFALNLRRAARLLGQLTVIRD